MAFLLKELVGTQESTFKIGEHKLLSNASGVSIADIDGMPLVSMSLAKITVNPFSFYWGTGPLSTGNVGDIVWNVNKSNPDNILCWRCTAPNTWQPQYTNPLQLPATPSSGTVAVYENDSWQAIAIEDLVISADQVIETVQRKFVTSEQLEVISNTSGINTGDETRQSILNTLGAANSQLHGYLTNTDYNKLQTAYDLATGLSEVVVEVPTKLSDLIDDINVATIPDLPTRVSQLSNDAGYITIESIPTLVSQLYNDAGYITANDLPTSITQLQNDAEYITVKDLAELVLNDLADVDTSSAQLTDGYVLTYNAARNAWIPDKTSSVTSVNYITADAGNVALTTTNIPEGINKYFTDETATTWANSYIETVALRQLQDVIIEDNEEATLLYFTDGAWRARRFEEITLYSIDNLADVELFDAILDFDVLTYNNGSWGNVAFKDNPKFILESLRDVFIQDPANNDVLVFDYNNRRWVNKSISLSSDGDGAAVQDDLSLNDLVDVSFVNIQLQTGSVLTYNAATGLWGATNNDSVVTSVNGQTGDVVLTTSNIAEGPDNLYYTVERVDERILFQLANADLNVLLGTGPPGSILIFGGSTWSVDDPSAMNLSTGDLIDFDIEGIENGHILVYENEHWTGMSIEDFLDIYGITTDMVKEGEINFYYTDERVETYLSTAIDVIPTAAIQDGAVTLAKIQNIASNTFLGNITASPAPPAELTFGDGFAFDGTTVNVSGGGLETVYVNTLTLNALPDKQYLLDGTTTVNLPAGVDGAIIKFVDYASNFGTVNVSIVPNGTETIAGLTSLELTTDNAYVELTFYTSKWVISGAESFLDIGLGIGEETDASLISVDTTNFDNNLGVADSTVQAALETLDDLIVGTTLNNTDDLPEGVTNLYYTDARVASYIAANPPPAATVDWGDIGGNAGDNPALEYELMKLFWVKS